jgi:hypothetical protein
MMPINTILHVTALAVRARVEARQEGNGDQLLLGGPVLVLKHAGGALGARPAQVVVVAEFVVVAALLDVVEGRLRDLEGRVEAAGAGVPLPGVSYQGGLFVGERGWTWTHHGAGFVAGVRAAAGASLG